MSSLPSPSSPKKWTPLLLASRNFVSFDFPLACLLRLPHGLLHHGIRLIADLHGLLTYMHYSLPYRLIQTSTDSDMILKLFEISHGHGVLRLCNVYSSPAKHTLWALSPLTVRGIMYMGEFNTWHLDLGDPSASSNHNCSCLLAYIRRHRL